MNQRILSRSHNPPLACQAYRRSFNSVGRTGMKMRLVVETGGITKRITRHFVITLIVAISNIE